MLLIFKLYGDVDRRDGMGGDEVGISDEFERPGFGYKRGIVGGFAL